MTLLYALLLLLAFYLMLAAEFCLPTGGLAGFGAAAAFISALVISFSHSVNAGVVMLATLFVTTPLVMSSLIRIYPRTPIGRRILNRYPGQAQTPEPVRVTSTGRPLTELVGRVGVAKSNLLPSGLVVVDGDKVDAFSAGMPIDAGDRIVVVSVTAGHVQVRPAADQEVAGVDADAAPMSPAALEQSLESLDFE